MHHSYIVYSSLAMRGGRGLPILVILWIVNFRWITLDELYGKPYIIYISNIIKFEDTKGELEV